jgi:hypothetical protein
MYVSPSQGAPSCCKRVDSSMPKAKQLCSTILLQFVEDNDPKKGAGRADSEHASSQAEQDKEPQGKAPPRTQSPSEDAASSPPRTSPSKQGQAPAKGSQGTAASGTGKAAAAASGGRPGRTPAANVEQNMASVAAAQWDRKEDMSREERGGGELVDSWDARMKEGELATGQELMHAGKNETAAVRQPLTIFAVMGTVTVASGAAFMLAKRCVICDLCVTTLRAPASFLRCVADRFCVCVCVEHGCVLCVKNFTFLSVRENIECVFSSMCG